MGRGFLTRASGVLLVLLLATASSGQDTDLQFNVTFTIGWDGCYRPAAWVPLDINIQIPNLKKPFGGALTVTAQQDSLTNMTLRREFVVTPDLPLQLPLASKIRYFGDRCDLAITDGNGRVRWRSEYSLFGHYGGTSGVLTAVDASDVFIGMSSGQENQFRNLAKCSRSSAPTYSGRSGAVRIKEKASRLLPWDWTGYAGLDMLVLYDPDWSTINSQQALAISNWVGQGGRLLIVLGSRPLPPDHMIAKLLPFTPTQPVEVTLTRPTVDAWGLDGARSSCWGLKGALAKNWQALALSDGSPYYVHGPSGFGHVGVLGLNMVPLGAKDRLAGEFWVPLLDTLDKRVLLDTQGSDAGDTSDRPTIGDAGRASNVVLSHLLAIPEMRPLSIWWVIGLLAMLALLLGPVDYLVLKRLDRLPLTWATSSLCIVLFSVGAYYGVQKIRGGAMQVRAVSVIDGVQGGPSWCTLYSGIFAPQSDRYRLQGLRPDQWWSAMSPGRDDSGYNYDPYSSEQATRNIYCSQVDGGNLPTDLPINIWSMQCLLSEAPLDQMPIGASLQWTQGSDQVVLSVQNRAACPVASGYLITKDAGGSVRTMRFEAVPPQGTREFRGVLEAGDPASSEAVGVIGLRSVLDAQGIAQRTAGIEPYLARGGAVVLARYDQAPLGFSVADYSCNVNHVQFVRLVIPQVPAGNPP